MKKNKIDLRFLYLFCPLLLLEIIFRIVEFHNLAFSNLIKIILFCLFFSLFVFLICSRFKNERVYFITSLVIIIWFCVYCFLELIFKNFMGDYYSFGTVGDGLGRIKQYAVLFVSNARWYYYFCLLPIPVYLFYYFKIKYEKTDEIDNNIYTCCVSLIILLLSIVFNNSVPSLYETYSTFSNKDILIDKLGMSHFFFRDITALYYKAPSKIEIVEEEIEEEVVEEEIVDLKRKIDDTLWRNIIGSEENTNLKTIDNYLINSNITKKNDYTGKYEGYNFIYFLVESGDYLMIDKDLTPHLYEIYNNGSTFYNHYTPLYSCGTGESEFVSYTSIFPYQNTCTPNVTANTYYYEALPFLFKNEGYATLAFHNWRDEWYDRNKILNHVGVDEYYDIDAIMKEDSSIRIMSGWQSDLMLVEKAYDHLKTIDGNYFAMIITSTMHFPYNENSYYGDLYVKEVNEVHPDYSIDFKRYMSKSIEFDKAIEYLLEQLKIDNKLESTVLCLYCDHRPYWLNYNQVIEYTKPLNNRTEFSNFSGNEVEKIGMYRSPFIIYRSGDEKNVNYNYCSTLDHVPTIANLFNLKYDPRLYMGKDIYSGSNSVIFTNGDWLNESGIYDASTNSFTPRKEDSKIDYSQVEKTNKQIQNKINISRLILDEKYFEKRKDICYVDEKH